MRTFVKSINFGLAYGIGSQGLADLLNIKVTEASQLIEDYFKAFPAIHKFLESLGDFGNRHGFSRTFPPYNRRRYYPLWKKWKRESSIERASKNHPIQGTSADITKRAMVLIRRKIIEDNLPVKMVLTVHDEINTVCKSEYAETWAVTMTFLMEKAAKESIKNGLLKSETTISDRWQK